MYETLKEKEICEILHTDTKTGLTQEEAGKRLESQGENVLKKGKEKTLWDMVQEQINDPMIFILFVAAAISMLLREFSDTGIILAVIFLNTAIGVIQEGKAVKAMEALKLFRTLADEGRGVILITHDIDLAFAFADRVAVFYAGTTVEIAPAADFRTGPEALRHPYSQALWRALPQNGFEPVPGFQPYAGNLPKGCLYAPRCPYKTPECEQAVPPVRTIRGGEVRCYHGA